MFARLWPIAAFVILLAAPSALAAAELSPPKALWAGSAGGVGVSIYKNDWRMGNLSQRARWEATLDKPHKGQHEVAWKVLSVVGRYVSVEESINGFEPGMAHPYAVTRYVAYDAKTGEKASLTQLVAPDAIAKALRGDTVLAKVFAQTQRVQAPSLLTGLLKQLNGYTSPDGDFYIGDDLMSRFALHHVKNGQVAVRFGLSHGVEVMRGKLTVLGMYMPVLESFKPHLEAARTGKMGFLSVNAPKGLTAGATVQ